jgi:hypothetical protein
MKWYRRKALLIPAAFISLLILVYLFRGPLVSPLLRNLVVSAAERDLGLQLTVGEIGGNYFSTLRLTDIRLSSLPTAALPFDAFFIRELRLSYALQDLFVSPARFIQRLRLEVIGLEAKVDLEKLSARAPAAAPDAESFPVAGVMPKVRVLGGSLEIVDGGNRLSLKTVDLDLSTAGPAGNPAWKGAVSVGQLGWRFNDTSGESSLAVRFQVSADKQISLADLVLGGRPVSRQAFFTYLTDDRRIAIQGRMDLLGSELVLEVDAAGEDQKGSLRLGGFQLERLNELFPGFAQTLKGTLAAEAEIFLPRGDPESMEASLSLSVGKGAVDGLMVEELSLKAKSASGRLTVEQLTVTSLGNDFALNDLVLPLPVLLHGSLAGIASAAEGNFSLRLGNLPAILKFSSGSPSEEGAVKIPEHELTLAGSIKDGVLTFTRGNFRSPVGGAEINAAMIRLPAEGEPLLSSRVEAELALLFPDIEEIGAVFGYPGLGGALSGKVQFSGPLADPGIIFDLKADMVAFRDLSFAEVRARGRNQGKLLDLDRLTFSYGDFSISLAGSGTADFKDSAFAFSMKEFFLTRLENRWQLQQPANFTYNGRDGLAVDEIFLHGAGDLLRMGGSVSAENELAVTASLSSASGKGWLDLLDDKLDLREAAIFLRLDGTVDQPEISLKGGVGRLGTRDLPRFFSGEVDLGYSGRGIEAHRFVWRTEQGSHISARGILPLALGRKIELLPGEIDFSFSVDIPELRDLDPLLPEAYSFSGALQGEAVFSGNWEDPRGSLTISVSGLTAPWLEELLVPLPLTLSGKGVLAKDRLIVEDFSAQSLRFKLLADGYLEGLPPLASILLGRPVMDDLRISAKLMLSADDIGWLAGGTKRLKKLSGAVRTELKLSGKLAHPGVDGTFSLERGELRHDLDFMPPLKNISLASTIHGGMLTIDTMQGELGGAPFSGQGQIDFSEMPPKADFRIKGENLLFYREDGLKVRADADLALLGALDRLRISGNVALTDSSFTRKFDFLGALRGSFRSRQIEEVRIPSFPEPPLKEAELQVRITAKNPFLVRNNLARGLIRPDLLLQGTGEVPYLTGRIYLNEGRLDLPAGRLYVDNGLINFPVTDPDHPLLEMQGRSKIAGYDISVSIQGRVDEPVVTLSSSPPLAEDALLYLVLTGKIPRAAGAGRTAGREKNLKVALYLAQGVLVQLFGSDSPSSETDLLDRFDIDLGRGITRKGDETIDARFRLLDEVLTEGGTLYITTEKDVYDEFNLGLKLLIRFD